MSDSRINHSTAQRTASVNSANNEWSMVTYETDISWIKSNLNISVRQHAGALIIIDRFNYFSFISTKTYTWLIIGIIWSVLTDEWFEMAFLMTLKIQKYFFFTRILTSTIHELVGRSADRKKKVIDSFRNNSERKKLQLQYIKNSIFFYLFSIADAFLIIFQ